MRIKTRAGEHEHHVRLLMGRTILLSLVFYKPLGVGKMKRNHLKRGGFLIWDEKRGIYKYADDIWNAISTCRYTTLGYDELELPDMKLWEDSLALMWTLTLLPGWKTASDKPEYGRLVGKLLDKFANVEDRPKERALYHTSMAMSMIDSLGRRNPPAKRASLAAGRGAVGKRVRNIHGIHGNIDKRYFWLLMIVQMMFERLGQIDAQVQLWMRENWTQLLSRRASSAVSKRRVDVLVAQMEREIVELEKINMLPIRHAAAHIMTDLRELVSMLQDPSQTALSARDVEVRLDAILLSLELQSFGKTVHELRLVVGHTTNPRLPRDLVPLEQFQLKAHRMMTWLVAREERAARVFRNNVFFVEREGAEADGLLPNMHKLLSALGIPWHRPETTGSVDLKKAQQALRDLATWI